MSQIVPSQRRMQSATKVGNKGGSAVPKVPVRNPASTNARGVSRSSVESEMLGGAPAKNRGVVKP